MRPPCGQCMHYTMQHHAPKMRKLGFGQCKLGREWEFPSPSSLHECARFAPIKPPTTRKTAHVEQPALI